MSKDSEEHFLALTASRTKVRLASVNEVDEMVQIINSAYRGESGRRGWTTEADFIAGQRVDNAMVTGLLQTENSCIIVAENTADAGGAESAIIGCVHVQVHVQVEGLATGAARAHFGLLTVSVDRQKQGIGDLLLAAAENLARKRFSAKEMSMYVISLRETLINWYERRGYLKTGEKAPFPYGEQRFGQPLRDDLEFIVMSKQLS